MGDAIGIVGLVIAIFIPLAVFFIRKKKTRIIGVSMFAILAISVIITGFVYIKNFYGKPNIDAATSQVKTPNISQENNVYDSKTSEVEKNNLFDFDYLSMSGSVFLHKNVTDNVDNFYSDCIDMCLHEYEYIEYYLQGKYQSIQGGIALSEEDKNAKSENVIKIYADDVLVYTSPKISAEFIPVEFDVDVAGAEKIKIVGETIESNWEFTNIYITGCELLQ